MKHSGTESSGWLRHWYELYIQTYKKKFILKTENSKNTNSVENLTFAQHLASIISL